jgi:hypothetical protein
LGNQAVCKYPMSVYLSRGFVFPPPPASRHFDMQQWSGAWVFGFTQKGKGRYDAFQRGR